MPIEVYTFSFLACDFQANCPNPTQFAAFTYTSDTPLAADPVPANSPGFFSPQEPLTVRPLAGSWDGLYLQSYDVYGIIGSVFTFSNFTAANGIDYGSIVQVDGEVGGPIVPSVVWSPGTYAGLIVVSCGTVSCPASTGAIESIWLVVTETPYQISAPAISLLPIGQALSQFPPGISEPQTAGSPPLSGAGIPEPASLALLLTGVAGLTVGRRTRRLRATV